jgi:putative membrane protein
MDTQPTAPGDSSEPDRSADNLPGHLVRGLLMGCADSVPGISGGTVALVLNIYERLVRALSHFNRQFLRLLIEREWKKAAGHVDLSFLGSLLAGIVIGLLAMTTLAHQLLSGDATRPFTLAFFLGMMLACSWIVARPLWPRTARECWTLGPTAVLAGLLAWTITELPGSQFDPPSLAYLFLSGMVGICAMILPGISGAMILLIMGVYLYLTGIPADLFAGQQVVLHLVELGVFASGCLAGLMIFSRLLRFLLRRFHAVTMSFLCGAMVGSMRVLWPFQQALGEAGSGSIGGTGNQLIFPSRLDRVTLGVLLATSFGLVIVVASRRLLGAQKKNRPENLPV